MTERGKAHSSLRVLMQRNFAPYFVGNFLSMTGTWFQSIAQSLLVYRLTGSSFMVGVVNFAQFAGVVVLSPWSGPAADRFDRKRLLIITQLGLSIVTVALAFLVMLGHGTVIVIVVQTLIYGFISAFATRAMQAIIPGLVAREDLAAAVAMNSVTFNLARAVGPVAGAAVVAGLGIAPAIWMDAGSYLILVAALLVVHPRTSKPPAAHRRPRLVDSIRTVWHQKQLLILLVAVAAISISMDPVSTLTPQFAKQIFHRSDTMSGALMGAFGAGAVLASLWSVTFLGTRPLASLLDGGLAKLVGVRITTVVLALPVVAAAGLVLFALEPGQQRAGRSRAQAASSV